jgi:hypothetical protein
MSSGRGNGGASIGFAILIIYLLVLSTVAGRIISVLVQRGGQ